MAIEPHLYKFVNMNLAQQVEVLKAEKQDRFDRQIEFTKRQTFAVMWHSAKNDNVGGWFDDSEVLAWLEYAAFPLVFGRDHCFQCHGFGGGPCGPHAVYSDCPTCLEEQ